MLVLHVRLRCGLLSITTPVSLLENKFDVQSLLHWQVSLAAVNQIYVFHEAMNGCKRKSKDSLKACFENVNISHTCPFQCIYMQNKVSISQLCHIHWGRSKVTHTDWCFLDSTSTVQGGI